MRRIVSWVKVAVVPLLLVAMLVSLGCSDDSSDASQSNLKVVTSTSLISAIVEAVGGDHVEVVNIIPPSQCPGHFDLKPGDVRKLADADLFLMHGWQGEKFSQSLIASVNNGALIVEKLNIPGNWMTPPVQLQAVDQITALLVREDAENTADYQKAATDCKEEIAAKEAEIKAKLAQASLAGIDVLCSEQQSPFLQWTGLNVVATYGEPDSLTPQVVKDLIDKGREAKATLVIDNLQSGADAGKGIAEELGARRITLSNFPGGFENAETWAKAIDKNIDLLIKALAAH
ncbi:MAG: metal ABC transporter substrate-binding protein [Dehalococcoidia bacterium]|nr:metal ABC transporter substrate-binding protein [Dehalococcoidia bacterium]